MRVGNRTESDHRPIEITLEKKIKRETKEKKSVEKLKTGQKKDAKSISKN